MVVQQLSASPPRPDPPMTYDEASMQGSRHFFMALQELKNLRPQLYSAAEYCESSYLFNDQKQMVLENLKDYTVKAIVNAVDHLGTVAYKLDEVLSQQIIEISSAELRVAGLAQRVRSCQEHRNAEGASQLRSGKLSRQYHKHYLLPDAMSDHKEQFEENGIGKGPEPHVAQSQKAAQRGRTLSWHMAADQITPRKGSQAAKFSGGSMQRGIIAEPFGSLPPNEHIGSSSSQTRLYSLKGHSEYTQQGVASFMDNSKPPSSQSSFEEKSSPQRGPVTTRSKSLLSSLLGRRRSGKQRDPA